MSVISTERENDGLIVSPEVARALILNLPKEEVDQAAFLAEVKIMTEMGAYSLEKKKAAEEVIAKDPRILLRSWINVYGKRGLKAVGISEEH